MKRCAELFVGGILALLISEGISNAQGGPPPPPCCSGDAPMIEEVEPVRNYGAVFSKMEVSELLLQGLGITRGQFLGRISQNLIPGRSLNRVIYSTLPVNRALQGLRRGDANADEVLEDGLILVQEKRFYQVDVERLQAENLAVLDEFYLSDGEIYVRVVFVKEE